MKEDKNKKTIELGTKPVGGLLLQYALPAIIAMTASSLYNMVDSIFFGYIWPCRDLPVYEPFCRLWCSSRCGRFLIHIG